jgi:hypothetical protein
MVSKENMPIIFNLALAEGCMMMIMEDLDKKGVHKGNVAYRRANYIALQIEDYSTLFPGSMSNEQIQAVAKTLQDVEDVIQKLDKVVTE